MLAQQFFICGRIYVSEEESPSALFPWQYHIAAGVFFFTGEVIKHNNYIPIMLFCEPGKPNSTYHNKIQGSRVEGSAWSADPIPLPWTHDNTVYRSLTSCPYLQLHQSYQYSLNPSQIWNWDATEQTHPDFRISSCWHSHLHAQKPKRISGLLLPPWWSGSSLQLILVGSGQLKSDGSLLLR